MATIQIKTEVSGSVWKIITAVGEAIEPGGTLMIIESMKMEIPVEAPRAGTVKEIKVAEGQTVQEGDTVAVLD